MAAGDEAITSGKAKAGEQALALPPEDRAGAIAWAQAHGVSRALHAKVSTLQAHDATLPHFAYDYLVAIVDLFEPAELSRYARVEMSVVLPLLRNAARAYVSRAADARRRELLLREAYLGRVLTIVDPLVKSFEGRLVALAASLADDAPHGPPNAVGYPLDQVSFVEGDEPSLEVALARATWIDLPPVRVALGPLVSAAGDPRATLARDNKNLGLAAQLAAVEAVLAALRDPLGSTGLALRAWAETPPWRRVLDRLARAGERGASAPKPASATSNEAPTSAPARLAFRVAPEGNQTPLVEALAQSPRKGGGFTAGRVVPYREAAALAEDEHERRIVDALMVLGPRDGRPADEMASRRAVSALLALADHPRVLVSVRSGGARPLRIRRGRLTIALAPAGSAEDGHLVKLAVAGHARDAGALLRARLADGTVLDLETRTDTLTLLPLDGVAHALVSTLAETPTPFPPEAMDALLGTLMVAQETADLSVPDELLGRAVDADVRPVVRLTPLPGDALHLSVAVRPLDGGPLLEPGSGPERALGSRDGARVSAHRLLEKERERAESMLAALPLGDAEREGPWVLRIDDGDRAANVIVALGELGEEVVVEWPEGDRPTIVTARRRDVRLRVERRRDWFGVEGEVELEGARISLATLLVAAREGNRFVRLGADRIVAIARELRERLVAADDGLVAGAKGELEASNGALPLVEQLVDGEAQIRAAKEWVALRVRRRDAETTDAPLPAGLHADLRTYQLEGFRWLARLAAWGDGAVLADDMGLGKTIQTLALLLHRADEGPALVVAPTTVAPNWLAEAARFAPSLRVSLYRGPSAERREGLATLGPRDVIVASYEIVTRDAEALAAVPFATLVLDEAQAIKNAASRRAAAARSLSARFRLALSGTPIENHLGELWSLFRVVSPRLLGGWERFRERFARPIERDRDPVRSAALGALVRPFLLRRTKRNVAPELPARTETVRFVELSPKERELYEAERLTALISVGEADPRQGRFAMLAALTRLRRLACHPRLLDAGSAVPSAKLAAFLELQTELAAAGHRALVFSQFTSHLALIRAELDAREVRYLYLDGETPSAERQRLVAAFQSGEGEMFLLSLKAGGTGINLTGADYVVHLDPWWNPATEDQATDRAHRIGQTKPVTVIRLVAKATIEEAVLALHGEKRELAESLLAGGEIAGALSAAELLALVRTGQDAVREAEDTDTR